MFLANLMLLLYTAASMTLGWGYFQRYALSRPPIGVINGSDLLLILGGVVVIPYLYLLLPTWGVALLLGLGAWGILHLTLEPLLPKRWLLWLVTVALLVADGGSAWCCGVATAPHRLINNGVMVLLVVGISNLWTQSGMKAGHVALLGGALTLYDFVFTTQLPLMATLFQQMAALPFAPQIVWPTADGGVVMGLGDLLFATLTPVVMAKAFGRGAGRLAFGLTLVAIASILTILWLSPDRFFFPAMVLLGPLLLLQYWGWRRIRPERTLYEYRRHDAASPIAQPAGQVASVLDPAA